MIRAPERFETARLVLRRPVPGDIDHIFERSGEWMERIKFVLDL